MIDFYLPKRKPTIAVNELGQIEIENDRKPNKENKRQNELEEYLGCTFIRINPDEKDFNVYDGLGKIQTFIDELNDEGLQELKDKIKEPKNTKNH